MCNISCYFVGITNTLGRLVAGAVADYKWVNSLLMHNMALVCGGILCIINMFCTSYVSMCLFAAAFGLCIGGTVSTCYMILNCMHSVAYSLQSYDSKIILSMSVFPHLHQLDFFSLYYSLKYDRLARLLISSATHYSQILLSLPYCYWFP